MTPTQVEQRAAKGVVNESPGSHATSKPRPVWPPCPSPQSGFQEPWCHLRLRALLFSTPTSVGFWGKVLTLLKLFVVRFTFLLLLSYLCVSRENNLLFTEDCQWLFSFSGAQLSHVPKISQVLLWHNLGIQMLLHWLAYEGMWTNLCLMCI